MPTTCLTIDAFTAEAFRGNPAGVCLLGEDREGGWMQAVAAELNLSETAFVRPMAQGFGLRWFTPRTEVDLCGHATLAAAHALWSEGVVDAACAVEFHTRSGMLTATLDAGCIHLDFPATPVQPCMPPEGLIEALGVEPQFIGATVFDAFVVVDSAAVLQAIAPDLDRLSRVPARGVIVTSPSDDPRFDCLSRYFAPAIGIAEDPVTGSAHCALAPFWADRLGKREMTAFQASRRGGVVAMRLEDGRVRLGGNAITVVRGELVTAAADDAYR